MARNLFRVVSWLILVAMGALIIWTSRLYFVDPIRVAFLLERPSLAANRLWRAMLAIHIAGGVGCLVALLLSSATARSKRWKWLHRWSGRFYAVIVLVLLCPSGLLMAPFAKGGLPGKFGFLLLVGLTFWFTWKGTRYAIERRFALHRKWMTRSMAMAATAMTFRLSQVVLSNFDISANTNYVASHYISTFGNWLVVEIWLGTRLDFSRSAFQSILLETEK